MSTTHLIVTAGLLAWIACAAGIITVFVTAGRAERVAEGWDEWDDDRADLHAMQFGDYEACELRQAFDRPNAALASLYPDVPNHVPYDWENETLHGLGDFDGGEAA